MQSCTVKITKEEYEKAKKEGASVLIDDSIKMGYGLYGCSVEERDGEYYLHPENIKMPDIPLKGKELRIQGVAVMAIKYL